MTDDLLHDLLTNVPITKLFRCLEELDPHWREFPVFRRVPAQNLDQYVFHDKDGKRVNGKMFHIPTMTVSEFVDGRWFETFHEYLFTLKDNVRGWPS